MRYLGIWFCCGCCVSLALLSWMHGLSFLPFLQGVFQLWVVVSLFCLSLPSKWCCPYQTLSADADWEKHSCWSPSLCQHRCLWSPAGLVVNLGWWLHFYWVSFCLDQLFGVVSAHSHGTRPCCACMWGRVVQKWEQAARAKEESSTASSKSYDGLR